MSTHHGPHTLGPTALILRPGAEVATKAFTPGFFEELDREFDGFRGHWLVQSFSFGEDWPTWEVHPAGDEIVYLLSGAADLLLRRPNGQDDVVTLSNPGDCVVVPRNTWHTARRVRNASMLFVTAGAGTENAEAPPY